MWRKPEDSRLKSSVGAAESAAPSAPSPGLVGPPDSSPAASSVKRGIVIKGEISGQGDLLLDGGFEGKVCLADGTFSVGSNAHVNAEVEAREIVIRGEFMGTLKAHERIQIMGTAKVTGNMDTRGIVIEDGAILHSKVATPPLAVQVSDSQTDDGVTRSHAELPVRKKSAAAAGPAHSSPQDTADH